MGILDTDHCCFNDAGMAAGMYSGLTYGLKETRGVHDWVNYGGFWLNLKPFFHLVDWKF